MKQSLKKALTILTTVILLVTYTACAKTNNETTDSETADKKKTIIKTDIYTEDLPDTSELDEASEPGVQIEFTMVDLGENVPIHTELQANYLADKVKSIAKYTKGTAALSECRKITLTWDAEINEPTDFKRYEVKVSDKKDFSNSYTYNATKKTVNIFNLKIGTQYYWRVYAVYQGQTYRSQVMTFTTEDIAPRNLLIEGVENVRDIGGWVTSDGGRIRQGLVFRTSRLNENASKSAKFYGSGKKSMGYLGIKTEIDLRSKENSYVDVSPLGKDVKFVNIPMNLDSDINILLTYPEEIKQVFEIFADSSNYPIVFHCSGGTDRAGLVAFLLEGLLGLDEEQLMRDYLFSNFATVGYRSGDNIDAYLAEINKAEGETLQERFYSYLLGLGITEEQLDNILRIMRTAPTK